MPESWKTRLLRWKFNWYPAYRRTGARIVYLSEDLMEARVRLPLNRATRNVHGGIFGGAMYAAVDPLQAVMLATHLGPDYLVWTKTAKIEFRRQARSGLLAHARIHRSELEEIRTALTRASKLDRDFQLSFADTGGQTVAHFTLTIHIRRRQAHEAPMHEVVFQ
ncbi:MAG: PaaI family thioesterase [Terriglobales bacterium]